MGSSSSKIVIAAVIVYSPKPQGDGLGAAQRTASMCARAWVTWPAGVVAMTSKSCEAVIPEKAQRPAAADIESCY
jgi:hypothetical protein